MKQLKKACIAEVEAFMTFVGSQLRATQEVGGSCIEDKAKGKGIAQKVPNLGVVAKLTWPRVPSGLPLDASEAVLLGGASGDFCHDRCSGWTGWCPCWLSNSLRPSAVHPQHSNTIQALSRTTIEKQV